MSTPANTPSQGVATTPALSKRKLDSLKKGPKVEIWIECEPFQIQGGDVQKWENQTILYSIPRDLVKHFSNRWKRDLAGRTTKRLAVPFSKGPTKVVVGWMMNGGGNKLGTPDAPYPKNALPQLKILKELATFLEIGSLIDLIAKDIDAATPILPPSTAAPWSTTENVVALECWHCHYIGHVRKDCVIRKREIQQREERRQRRTQERKERNAVYRTWSDAKTYSMRSTSAAVETSTSGNLKLKPVSDEIVGIQPASEKPKLKPVSDGIMVVDQFQTLRRLTWTDVEIKVDGPPSNGMFKITGTASGPKG